MMKAICLGTLIMDFIALEPGALNEVYSFKRCPGGAAANVAIGLHHHDVDAVLVSRVGADTFGHTAVEDIARYGITPRFITADERHPTRCSFISYEPSGRRLIEIVNRQSADQFIQFGEVRPALLDGVRLLYIDGVMLVKKPLADMVMQSIDLAKQKGAWIAFDPVIKVSKVSAAIKHSVLDVVKRADLIKVNEEEYLSLAQEIEQKSQPTLVIHTRGAQGARIITPNHSVDIPPPVVHSVDPTGAGDAFFAAVLASALREAHQKEDLMRVGSGTLRRWGEQGSRWAGRVIEEIGSVTAYR